MIAGMKMNHLTFLTSVKRIMATITGVALYRTAIRIVRVVLYSFWPSRANSRKTTTDRRKMLTIRIYRRFMDVLSSRTVVLREMAKASSTRIKAQF